MNAFCYVDSPIGRLMLTTDGTALTGLYMNLYRNKPTKLPDLHGDWLQNPTIDPLPAAARQLKEYFAGTRREFNLPLRIQGTEFQQRVWHELTKIPFGETRSYGQLAKRLNNPNGSRAVGLANGRNPIAIIVPCHRVIGADGSLTGFGGGIDRKEWLLTHEGQPVNRELPLGGAVGSGVAA
ncbi:MAG TPA: methylated-DNA--[protein]-cysteine S-methyltransferase [Steroidobacteraceae bacterium]|jgi:methylated-DNA-[protein]-cysteine S-methyltransferase|nr:methylated-DNA--[protein]-cysteine S-methyltransferase [Steroidobacteraceae bacterium]